MTAAHALAPWRTAAIDAGVDPLHGWVPLPSGVEITARPLVDDTGATDWARLTYRDALAVAARFGGRLPTREEVLESIERADVVLHPVTLSYGPEMVTLAHAQEHDRRVREQLGGLPKGSRPRPLVVAGIGKHWVAGAAPGRARICGWMRPDTGRLIQAGTTDVHDDLHHDYSTTTLVVRDAVHDTDPAPAPEPHGSPLPPRSLGLRALDVARELLAQGVRERPGPASEPIVSAMLYPARRGGTPVAGILDATGTRLGLTADATAWCAAMASYCLAMAIERGAEPSPHGYRLAVAELVADARALGTWRERGYRPQPGDLAIWTRAGGDPRRGGTGHVARVEGYDPLSDRIITIGGNEADSVRRQVHEAREPIGWIAYP